MIIRTSEGSAPTRYKEQRDSGERKKDAKTREPIELASEATGSNKEQLRGQGTMQPKEIQKENERNR